MKYYRFVLTSPQAPDKFRMWIYGIVSVLYIPSTLVIYNRSKVARAVLQTAVYIILVLKNLPMLKHIYFWYLKLYLTVILLYF